MTYHNWDTSRQGGFHKFAEKCAREGHNVSFFSLQRPFYIALKNEERLNIKVLFKLTKGLKYFIRNAVYPIVNFTWPSLKIPLPLSRYIPQYVNDWFNTHSLIPFWIFNKIRLSKTDIFVFESCDGLELFDKIAKFHPNAKLVYRPSDPIMIDGAPDYLVTMETKVLLKSNITVLVNEESLNLYRKHIPDFDKIINYKIIPNGVDIEKYRLNYLCPPELSKKNTALYVGARPIEWDLIIEAAKACANINFVIVCPERPNSNTLQMINEQSNITYIPGIKPSEVPKWVTNCDVIIVPNPAKEYQRRPWGITAKYYQAMAARKPIVAFDDSDTLRDKGIEVCHSYNEFIETLKRVMDGTHTKFYEFSGQEWDTVTKEMCDCIVTAD